MRIILIETAGVVAGVLLIGMDISPWIKVVAAALTSIVAFDLTVLVIEWLDHSEG